MYTKARPIMHLNAQTSIVNKLQRQLLNKISAREAVTPKVQSGVNDFLKTSKVLSLS